MGLEQEAGVDTSAEAIYATLNDGVFDIKEDMAGTAEGIIGTTEKGYVEPYAEGHYVPSDPNLLGHSDNEVIVVKAEFLPQEGLRRLRIGKGFGRKFLHPDRFIFTAIVRDDRGKLSARTLELEEGYPIRVYDQERVTHDPNNNSYTPRGMKRMREEEQFSQEDVNFWAGVWVTQGYDEVLSRSEILQEKKS